MKRNTTDKVGKIIYLIALCLIVLKPLVLQGNDFLVKDHGSVSLFTIVL